MLAEKCIRDIKITKVSQAKPHNSIVKLNFDGSALENPGKIGVGGIVIDDLRNLIYAYATPVGISTYNLAEMEADKWGLSWCIKNKL